MKPFFLFQRIGMLAFVLAIATSGLSAAPIDFSILTPNQIGFPGDVITFTGTITNNSGVDLDSTDLFLNFSGFDPVNVTLDQLLGLTPFTIPNGTTSPVEDLFTFTLGSSAGPGTYPADVVLQDAVGDISPTQTVTVTIVPEPGSLSLMAGGLSALIAGLFRTKIKNLLLLLLIVVAIGHAGFAQVSGVKFVSGTPGLATSGTTLMTATQLTNNGTVTATNVQVTGATLRTLTAMGSFPVTLGTVSAGGTKVVQANFNSSTLSQNTKYLLTIRGTYQVGSAKAGFSVNRFITLPVPSPGSDTVVTVSVPAQTVTGAPFPHRPPDMDNEVNFPRSPVPTGPFISGTQTPTTTGAVMPPGNGSITRNKGSRVAPQAGTVLFNLDTGIGTTSAGTNCNPGVAPASCAEPSGANSGTVIFVTANWMAAYSTDNGATFNQLDPTTIFPNDAIGFCCDQQVQYVPSIDRFVWLLQGNGVRLAEASPQQIINSKGTSWTYWNFDAGLFGFPSGTGFDYPDTSFGITNFFMSWDVGFPQCPQGCTSGLIVVRMPLSQIQAGGTIFFDFTHPGDSSLAWGSHLTQDPGDEIFWAGHNGNSQLRIWSLADGSNTYFWRDRDISSWPNNTLSSTTPDNQDWLKFGFPGNAVIGATRNSTGLWFAWTAGTNNSFQQPHVEIVEFDRSNNFSKTQQVQVWNNGFAFAYPALATDVCTDEIGLSLGIGGNGSFENHAVGIWGDFLVFQTTNSSSGVNRYGDYNTIRAFDGGGLFDAMGYGISTVKGSMQSDARFVEFGRPCIIGSLQKTTPGKLDVSRLTPLMETSYHSNNTFKQTK